MKRIQLLIASFLLGVVALLPQTAHAAFDQAMADSVAATLISVKTPADSIRVLYDVFDLSTQKNKLKVGWQIIEIADRTKDYSTLLDIIPQVAVMNKDKEDYKKLRRIASHMPEGDERKCVETFIRVEKAIDESIYSSAEKRRELLLKYAKEDMTPKYDIYEDVFDLYRMLAFLGKASQGNMYFENLKRLEGLIDQLPESNYALRNLFYTTAAIYCSETGHPEMAVECDRKLLEIIPQLEAKYKKMGRKYRSYDRYYYISYRRMLSNFSVLSLDEVRDLYARCEELASKDMEVKGDFNNHTRTTAYLLMAEKKYGEAIPYLQKELKGVMTDRNRCILLGLLVQAADSVGDNATLLGALRQYNNLLEEEQRLNVENANIELQIRYDVNKLEADKDRLTNEKHALKEASDQKIISVALIALMAFAIILMLLYRSHFRLRHRKRELERENVKLHKAVQELLDGDLPPSTIDAHEAGKKHRATVSR